MDQPASLVFGDQNAFATGLIALGVDRFHDGGTSPINWAPQTWVDEVAEECGIQLPEVNLHKIMGGCLILTHPHEFYQSEASFGDVTSAVAGEWFDTQVWHPPSTSECLWAVVESYLLDPPEDKNQVRFGPAVVRYVNMIARDEGFRRLPDVFHVFGLPRDHGLPPPEDYSSDPALFAADSAGEEERQTRINGWLSDRMAEFAQQIKSLPLRSGTQHSVAAEILKR